MPNEHGFRDDGTKATRFYKPNDGDDRMNENDEDVDMPASYQNLKKSRNSGRFCNSPPSGVVTYPSITQNILSVKCFIASFHAARELDNRSICPPIVNFVKV